jgi:hypothetical protein
MSKLSPGEVESLNKLRKVVGNGSKNLVASVSSYTGLGAYSFIVQEDTAISLLKVNGTDVTSDYGLGGSVTVKGGAYFVVPEGSVITDITVDSGSVIIYNL